MIDDEAVEAAYIKVKEAEERQFFIESSTIPDYFKNVLLKEYHAEFEQVLESIQHDLKLFHTNLFYSKKILDFIDKEFKYEGVFPQDLIFLQLFITNTMNSMILTSYKLVLDTPKLQSKENGGISYLNSLINTKMIDNEETKEFIRNKLKECKPLFKEYKSLCKLSNIDILRKSKIAHYDIGKQEEIKKIKVDLDTLQKIYNLGVKIFDILSLKYFERYSIFNFKMIETHSFKKFVCQNVMLNNPNEFAQLDIDIFFSCLRRNFLSSLSNKHS